MSFFQFRPLRFFFKKRISFICNICNSHNISMFKDLGREIPSCKACGSTVRMRGMIQSLSMALFNQGLPIDNFPESKGIKGIGTSDWEGYALPLSKKFSYVNTYYHKEPRLDITDISSWEESSLDFIISSDVFEHVLRPCSLAFENSYKLLKQSGKLILSVPYTIEGDDNREHFPVLRNYYFEDSENGKNLCVKTDVGIEKYDGLVFHGGDGSTLEMRVFSINGLLNDLKKAGFKEIYIQDKDCLEFGIYWPDKWSLPIVAVK